MPKTKTEIPTINVDMDERCTKCGAEGACDNGLCLKCNADALPKQGYIKARQGFTTSEVMLRHQELRADLAKKMESQQWWANALETDHMRALVNEMQDSIQRNRVALEDAKSEDVKTNQAQIVARKQVVSYIQARASQSPVFEAKKRLEEYERDNAIFLTAECDQRKAEGAGE